MIGHDLHFWVVIYASNSSIEADIYSFCRFTASICSLVIGGVASEKHG